MENKEFNYTYRAPTEAERREIADIRKQYSAPADTENKLERLRRLDNRVRSLSTAIPLVVGVLGCLIFGLGLTLILQWGQMAFGIVVSAMGVLAMLPAYPLYRAVLRYTKNKYGPEILQLSQELLGESDEA